MRPTPNRPARAVVSALALACLLPSGRAAAGNDDALLHGADAAMTGGAVTAMTEDGASAYYNPAGIALVERARVNVSASAVVLQRLEVTDFLAATSGERTDEDILVLPFIPAAVTFAGKLSDRVSYGGGIFVSQQFAYTIRGALDVPGVSGGAPPFNFTLAVEQREINTVPGMGVGFHVLPNLRLGVALFGRYREQYGALVFGAGTPLADGMSSPSVIATSSSFGSQGAGVEARVGAQWEPVPELVLGASIWTPTFNVFTATQETDTAVLTVTDPEGEVVPVYVPSVTDTRTWGFDQVSSWRFRLGAAWRQPWGWVAVDGDVQTAYRNQELGVERALNWNLRAGAKIRVTDVLTAGVGLFTDRSPLRDDADILLAPHVDLYGFTLGVTYDDAHRLAEGEGVDDIRFMTGFAIRFAYGRGDFGSLLLDPNAGPDDTLVVPQASPATLLEASLYLVSGLHF